MRKTSFILFLVILSTQMGAAETAVLEEHLNTSYEKINPKEINSSDDYFVIKYGNKASQMKNGLSLAYRMTHDRATELPIEVIKNSPIWIKFSKELKDDLDAHASDSGYTETDAVILLLKKYRIQLSQPKLGQDLSRVPISDLSKPGKPVQVSSEDQLISDLARFEKLVQTGSVGSLEDVALLRRMNTTLQNSDQAAQARELLGPSFSDQILNSYQKNITSSGTNERQIAGIVTKLTGNTSAPKPLDLKIDLVKYVSDEKTKTEFQDKVVFSPQLKKDITSVPEIDLSSGIVKILKNTAQITADKMGRVSTSPILLKARVSSSIGEIRVVFVKVKNKIYILDVFSRNDAYGNQYKSTLENRYDTLKKLYPELP